MQKLRNKEGFTLIELMIVIAIIGILAAIAIPNFISYRKKAYDGAANANIQDLATAVNAYYATDNETRATIGCTITDAAANGFRQTPNVNVVLTATDQDDWVGTTAHLQGDITYSVTAAGVKTSG